MTTQLAVARLRALLDHKPALAKPLAAAVCKAPSAMLNIRVDVLWPKVAALAAELRMSEAECVAFIAAKAPQLLTMSAATLLGTVARLKAMFRKRLCGPCGYRGRGSDYVFAMLIKTPKVLYQTPDTLQDKYDALAAAAAGCDKWGTEWDRMSAPSMGKVLLTGRPKVQHLRYCIEKQKFRASMQTVLSRTHEQWAAREPDYPAWLQALPPAPTAKAAASAAVAAIRAAVAAKAAAAKAPAVKRGTVRRVARKPVDGGV